MPAEVLFYIFVTLNGSPQPFKHEELFKTPAECLARLVDVTLNPPQIVLEKGGQYQAGCLQAFPPSVNH